MQLVDSSKNGYWSQCSRLQRIERSFSRTVRKVRVSPECRAFATSSRNRRRQRQCTHSTPTDHSSPVHVHSWHGDRRNFNGGYRNQRSGAIGCRRNQVTSNVDTSPTTEQTRTVEVKKQCLRSGRSKVFRWLEESLVKIPISITCSVFSSDGKAHSSANWFDAKSIYSRQHYFRRIPHSLLCCVSKRITDNFTARRSPSARTAVCSSTYSSFTRRNATGESSSTRGVKYRWCACVWVPVW